MTDLEIRRLVRAESRRHHGVVAGLLGCCFAVIGIFTIGILFVPLAILCSVIGFARAAGALSVSGLAISLLGCFLSTIGVLSSPSLSLVAAGLFAAGQHEITTASPAKAEPAKIDAAASVVPATDPLPDAAGTPYFNYDADSEKLPLSGPRAWCRRPETIENIMKALSGAKGVREFGVTAIDFENSTTVSLSVKKKAASCHGVGHFSNGQLIPGTFSIYVDETGQSKWRWMNDDNPDSRSNGLITCGMAGCTPNDDSAAARKAADGANAELSKAAMSELQRVGAEIAKRKK